MLDFAEARIMELEAALLLIERGVRHNIQRNAWGRYIKDSAIDELLETVARVLPPTGGTRD